MDAALDAYGLVAAAGIMLVKAAGLPIPIPGDVILLAVAARAAAGKLVLGVAFVVLLAAIVAGGVGQYLLARGPARGLVNRYGPRLGVTPPRLERIAASVRRGGVLGIGIAVLTPGVRSAVIPACGLSGVPMRLFLPGLVLGSGIDLGLHFAIGYVGASLLEQLTASAPLVIVPALALIGLVGWLAIARRRHASSAVALNAWVQATCPVCLVVGSVASLETEPAVRFSGAV